MPEMPKIKKSQCVPVADVVLEVTAAGGEVRLVFFLVVDLAYKLIFEKL